MTSIESHIRICRESIGSNGKKANCEATTSRCRMCVHIVVGMGMRNAEVTTVGEGFFSSEIISVIFFSLEKNAVET